MVLIRNNVTKESTYGWYPSQVDVYQNPREKIGYEKEILFRHSKSQLHHTNPSGVTPPETPPHVKRARARTATVRSQRGSKIEIIRPKTATSNIVNTLDKLKIEGSKANPQFGVTFNTPSRAVSRSIGIPTPKVKPYHGWQPQPTIIGTVDPDGPFIAQSPELNIDVSETAEGSTERPTAPLPPPDEESVQLTPAQKLSGSFRVKSASLHRPKISSSRSIKSAGTRCKSTAIHIPLDSKTARDIIEREESDRNLAAPSYFNQLKHEITRPDEDELSPHEDDMQINARPITKTPDATNYNDQNRKYGWRMEVHGDPYGIKRPALPDRLSYAVKCDEPIVAESPYKCKVMVGETFFSNTIPRHRATFTVHPEWQSEHFVEQRKELEKQGRKFHVRNFGFVY